MDKLDYCTVTVREGEGASFARYRWIGNEGSGSDTFDEDLSSWSDDDIREHVAAIVGIDDDQLELIDIERD